VKSVAYKFEGKLMTIWRETICTVFLLAVVAPASLGKVYVSWTQSSLPSPTVLGVSDLVIPWDDEAKGLVEAAKKQGYRVFLEVKLEEGPAAAEAASTAGIQGIVLKAEPSDASLLEQRVDKLRSNYPKLKFLVLDPGGRQPQLRGWLVFKKDGILQVSSPTSQPWLDANLAMIRHERAFQPAQPPLYTFSWDLSDEVVKEQGPSTADYSLAVAEAGAFHADLLLEVHPRQQKGLATGDKDTLANWTEVKRTIDFYAQANPQAQEAPARVAVLTNDYDSSYEAINLMARHNIPYRVLHSAEVKAPDLLGFDVLIAFAPPNQELTVHIRDFAERGGVAVLVNVPGTYSWDSSAPQKTSPHSVSYTVGKGRVIELDEAVTDPETFARDVRRLMVKERVPVSLWNSLTTLVTAYPGPNPGELIVELINYDQELTQVQVQVRGNFSAVTLETPERGCCETLKASQVDGFTEFVVPDVFIGARVHLQGSPASSAQAQVNPKP
jgi:hypothetical protein